jgi:hypothetical protein
MPNPHTKTPLGTGFLRSFIRWLVIGVMVLWSLAALTLVAARWIDPADNRSAHPASLADLDSPYAVSRTLQATIFDGTYQNPQWLG